MTSEEREQWAQEAERSINIPAMMDLPCGQIERNAHEKLVGWYLQKAFELGLSGQRDVYVEERRDMLERLQHYIATTAPTKRCPCKKGVVLVKTSQHVGACDAKPAVYRKENELGRSRRNGC